ncbi:LytR/AlgR family response regulator transcription factor [Portibacter lacus]|uniref:DNA-binding response regulator n=1 Tax=Portibacter lacus TaxID=1099794 RepID=A0AA37SQM7_9BACT|nr:LytTR family DNA-binding domain-containing protein [Portibacter lacus]GLR15935.1 DNA-binding response regulator [Portibacter lacus]
MQKVRALIIDDEDHCRSTLAKQIEWYCPQVDVVGEGKSASEARILIKDLDPDLVFLDIEMPSESGFDLLKSLDRIKFKLIFTTAFDEYALEAFKVNAIAYLLKPIEGQELADALEKITVEKQDEVGQRLESLMKFLAEKDHIKKVALPVLEGLQFVLIDDIVRGEASGNYSTVYMKNGSSLFISKTLKYILEAINHSKFIRVHQSHFINMDYIHKYIRGKNGQIILDNGTAIPVSRSKKDEFLDLF